MQTNKLKQKIMVNGVSYELQSIFGMDQNDKKNREVPPSPLLMHLFLMVQLRQEHLRLGKCRAWVSQRWKSIADLPNGNGGKAPLCRKASANPQVLPESTYLNG
jgi:hypothetical protein